MIETRILKQEIRSLRASNIQIRMDENSNSIFILGSLPIRSLSSPITDKTGKKFRECVEPLAFKLALMKNKAYGYKTKLLKNHLYECEFEYEELKFDEVNERELRFLFKMPKSQRNLELLEDVSEDNASFSFGFICGSERKALSNEKGIDYIRIIDSFQELREISILDIFTSGAYESAKGFKADYLSGEKKAQKFVTKKNREALCEAQDKKLKEMKSYIERQRRNSLFGFGDNVKISMN